MKLNIMLLTALLAMGHVCAQHPCETLNRAQQEQELSSEDVADILEEDIAAVADDVAMIEYRVVVYKDRTKHGHDADAWEGILAKTTRALRLMDEDNWSDAVTDVFATAKEAGDGIHGEISVSFSDGNPSECCGEKCRCVDRYKGNCPCGMVGRSCNTRSTRCDECGGKEKEEKVEVAPEDDCGCPEAKTRALRCDECGGKETQEVEVAIEEDCGCPEETLRCDECGGKEREEVVVEVEEDCGCLDTKNGNVCVRN